VGVTLVILVAIAIVVGIVWSQVVAARRREALAALAGRLGLVFEEEEDHDLAETLDFLRRLDEGSNRYVYNRLEGQYGGHHVQAFDFHYETYSHSKNGRQTSHHHFSVVTLRLPRPVPEVLITPEGIFSKIAQALGYDDIDFESAEFSRAFCVRSADKKFAYDICHPLMMEYLLSRRGLSVEFEDRLIALAFESQLEPEEIETWLQEVVKIRELMPDYLFTAR
jgi:hypothetical protein